MKNAKQEASASKGRHLILGVFGILLGLSGLFLAIMGAQLVTLGGSWYYLLAGFGLLISGVLYLRRKPAATLVIGVVFVATVIWALWEVGFTFWPMVPRLAPFLVIGLLAALLHPWLTQGRHRAASYGGAAVFAGVLAVGFNALFTPHGVIEGEPALAVQPQAKGTDKAADWSHYGSNPAGTRFSAQTQINKDNVDKLQVAWTYRTGEIAEGASEYQNTPIQVMPSAKNSRSNLR